MYTNCHLPVILTELNPLHHNKQVYKEDMKIAIPGDRSHKLYLLSHRTIAGHTSCVQTGQCKVISR